MCSASLRGDEGGPVLSYLYCYQQVVVALTRHSATRLQRSPPLLLCTARTHQCNALITLDWSLHLFAWRNNVLEKQFGGNRFVSNCLTGHWAINNWKGLICHHNPFHPLEHVSLGLVDANNEWGYWTWFALTMQTLIGSNKSGSHATSGMVQQVGPTTTFELCLTTLILSPFCVLLGTIIIWNVWSEVKVAELPRCCLHSIRFVCLWSVSLQDQIDKGSKMLWTPIFSYAICDVPLVHNYSHPAPAS
jgi:hypothetical protein